VTVAAARRPGSRSGARGGYASTRRRTRRRNVGKIMWRLWFWPELARWVWLFFAGWRSYPLRMFAGAVWLSVWVKSGFLVACVLTPALFAVGTGVWFWVRYLRTGLSLAEAVGQLWREFRVRKQWPKACDRAKWGVVPDLRWRPWPWPAWHRTAVVSKGDTVVVTFSASAVGLDREPIMGKLTTLAEVMGGGCRAARMTALGNSGLVRLTFDFADADPLAKAVTPNMLPAAPKGCIPYGLSEEGSSVFFRLQNERRECVFTPLLIAGAARSGKSSTVWATLLGFIVAGIPVRLWVSDPKGGMELTALEDAKKLGAGTAYFKVEEYTDTPEGSVAMVKRMHAEMNKRATANKGKRRRAHIPTVEEPFNLLLCDELLLLDEVMKDGKKSPFAKIQLAGPATGYSIIACTQLSKTDAVNSAVRDLFVRRMCFRVGSKDQVETALGSGNGWWEKAPAHKIKDCEATKGVGYVVDTEGITSSSTEAVRFRSVWIDDDAIEYIAAGEIPPRMERFATEQIEGKKFLHAHYRYFDATMRLIYTGETNDWKRRHGEHMRRAPWRNLVIEDAEHVLVEWHRGDTPGEAYAVAKAAETKAIQTEMPLYNKAENERNPLRVVWDSAKGRGKDAA
jgi:hypothetical protein